MPAAPSRVRELVFNAPFGLPMPVQRLAAGQPVRLDGLTLDPQMQIVCRFLALAAKAPGARPIDVARAEYDAMALAVDRPDPAMARLVETQVPGPNGPIPITLHVPFGASRSAPAVVYYHGGGFVFGSRKTVAGVCHRIAEGTSAIVVNVEYRLAPEHPFPAGVEDALAAYRWVREHGHEHGIDTRRVAVAGDSAGGNLSAVVSLLARDRGLPVPTAQWLIYPVTHAQCDTPSRSLFSKGFLLERAQIDWFHATYGGDERDPLVSPLLAARHDGLPPALVSTAGFDPLRDEGESYARALERAGTRARLVRHGGLIHGFANLRFGREACRAVDVGIGFLRAELRA